MWNGNLYSITNWDVVFALDARTGKELWRWDPEVNQDKTRPKICCGVVQRGIALYEGLIIAPIIDGRLIALDAMTGKPVWESRVSYSQDNYTLDHGSSHREGQSDHRRQRSRTPHARFLRRLRRQDRQACLDVLHRSRRPLQAVRKSRAEESRGDLVRRLVEAGRRRLGVGRHGLRSRTSTCSTSAPATAAPGRRSFANRKARTISTSAPWWL